MHRKKGQRVGTEGGVDAWMSGETAQGFGKQSGAGAHMWTTFTVPECMRGEEDSRMLGEMCPMME
ncbi:Uncharacterized protein DAT39_021208 [Clarias magur]|uniref:Uncharacterized protein n=1 Tax=Clarias magur TaxID=1594786 RepID=A0A8J4WSH5_CLAMG|nr:Uncharacterized protein DAT39_021208 [Clarias magur]